MSSSKKHGEGKPSKSKKKYFWLVDMLLLWGDGLSSFQLTAAVSKLQSVTQMEG